MATKRVFNFGHREDYVEFFDDFLKVTAADWTKTSVDGGTDSASVFAVAAGHGGLLTLTTNDAATDAEYIQWKNETFRFTSGKRLYFAARFAVGDATDSDVVIGLQITDTTPIDVTDGIFFRKPDTDTFLDFHVEKNGTQSTLSAIKELADSDGTDEFVRVEFYYDGADKIEVFVDGSSVGAVALTNAPDDEDLTVSFGVLNGEAAAKSIYIDYIRVVAER